MLELIKNFIANFLCARDCSRWWEYHSEHDRQKELPSLKLYLSQFSCQVCIKHIDLIPLTMMGTPRKKRMCWGRKKVSAGMGLIRLGHRFCGEGAAGRWIEEFCAQRALWGGVSLVFLWYWKLWEEQRSEWAWTDEAVMLFTCHGGRCWRGIAFNDFNQKVPLCRETLLNSEQLRAAQTLSNKWFLPLMVLLNLTSSLTGPWYGRWKWAGPHKEKHQASCQDTVPFFTVQDASNFQIKSKGYSGFHEWGSQVRSIASRWIYSLQLRILMWKCGSGEKGTFHLFSRDVGNHSKLYCKLPLCQKLF